MLAAACDVHGTGASHAMAEASAPASSANLGPGFDVLALALELRCRVTAQASDDWKVAHEGAQQPDVDSDDAVLAGARLAVGEDRPVTLLVDNEIPIGRGLGSSAAALAAGAAAALSARGETVNPRHVFELVAEAEGHPDNAAAAVYGGLILVCAGGEARRLPIHPGIRPILAVPKQVFLTAEARKLVADTVSREVAVRTAARISALVTGFLTGGAEFFADAQGDELHEAPRAKLRPDTAELVTRAQDAGALHAAWSGSGPSVIALVESEDEERVVNALTSPDVRVFQLSVAANGLEVSA